MARSVLVIVAHPDLQKSRVNAALSASLSTLDNVTIHNLQAAAEENQHHEHQYDVAKEQALLLAHQVIVFQFPLYWYSVPGLLKDYMDQILLRGFAYGGVNQLKGKTLVVATSTGSSKSIYSKEGLDQITVEELLAPLKTTALRVKMQYSSPFVTYAVRDLTDEDLQDVCTKYRSFICAHRDGGVTQEEAKAI